MEENTENMKKESSEGTEAKNVPRILKDFMADILTTFPEYAECIESYAIDAISGPDLDNDHMNHYVEYVQECYPSRFFDILYKNEEIFNPE